MTRVALVRHGRTPWNAARRIQGTTDIPLDDTGRAQAHEAAAALAALGDWSCVVSSPLLRARETATIIAARLGIPLLEPVAGLTERDCGEAEGLPVDEAALRWPARDYAGGEPLQEVGRRVAEALSALADAGTGAIAVGHGIALRTGVATLTGTPAQRLANAEIIVLEREQGSWLRADALSAVRD
ncbi:histidine phosphatase family protein [Agrococcus baldri]|uniref:Phosphoglycerate mutase GpmB n=1 Tax=Agrococcus baldri TaxID=153730 RepID=A0AA87RH87_9MICO|nr:histidine phosphatase family protein [Agrococcus baldri]GEK80290.1 putative phosphoglycerate mutase GpmB [Agrococcus baldri]